MAASSLAWTTVTLAIVLCASCKSSGPPESDLRFDPKAKIPQDAPEPIYADEKLEPLTELPEGICRLQLGIGEGQGLVPFIDQPCSHRPHANAKYIVERPGYTPDPSRYGYMRIADGATIIPAKLRVTPRMTIMSPAELEAAAYAFHEGLAAFPNVGADDQVRWGYINMKGEVVFEPVFMWARPFSPGGVAHVTMRDPEGPFTGRLGTTLRTDGWTLYRPGRFTWGYRSPCGRDDRSRSPAHFPLLLSDHREGKVALMKPDGSFVFAPVDSYIHPENPREISSGYILSREKGTAYECRRLSADGTKMSDPICCSREQACAIKPYPDEPFDPEACAAKAAE